MMVYPGQDGGRVGLSVVPTSTFPPPLGRRASINGGGDAEHKVHNKACSSAIVASWFQSCHPDQKHYQPRGGGNVGNNPVNESSTSREGGPPGAEVNLRAFLPSHYNRQSLYDVSTTTEDDDGPHHSDNEDEDDTNENKVHSPVHHGDASTVATAFSVFSGFASAVAPLQAVSSAVAVATAGGVCNAGSTGRGEGYAGRRWSLTGSCVGCNNISFNAKSQGAKGASAFPKYLPQPKPPTKRRSSASEQRQTQMSQTQRVGWQKTPDHETDGYSYNYAYSGYYDRRQELGIGGPRQHSSQEQAFRSSVRGQSYNATGNVFQSLQNSLQAVAEKFGKGGADVTSGMIRLNMTQNGTVETGPTMHEMAQQIVNDKDEFKKLQESLRQRRAHTSMGLRQELYQGHLLQERYESSKRNSLEVGFGSTKGTPSSPLITNDESASTRGAGGGARSRRFSLTSFTPWTSSGTGLTAFSSVGPSTSIQTATANNRAAASMLLVESHQRPGRRRFSLSSIPSTTTVGSSTSMMTSTRDSVLFETSKPELNTIEDAEQFISQNKDGHQSSRTESYAKIGSQPKVKNSGNISRSLEKNEDSLAYLSWSSLPVREESVQSITSSSSSSTNDCSPSDQEHKVMMEGFENNKASDGPKQRSRRSMMHATQQLAHHAEPLQIGLQSQQEECQEHQKPVQWTGVNRRRSIW